MIEKNIKEIKKDLKGYDCKLVCVSKTRSDEEIMEAYDVGCRDFGENHVQDLCEKRDRLPKDIRWHMIGHIQTNKVKALLEGEVSLIHSVDSVKIANELNKRLDHKQDILLEINIAEEESKYGFPPNLSFLKEILKQIEKLEHLNCIGLMCVAPDTDNPLKNKKYFEKMKKYKESLGLKVLSMGMTNDYKIALESDANYIRIGTGIFGERDYTKKDK